MYEYQKNNRYFAQIADGIKELGAIELSELGASDISPVYRGIYFNCDKESLYRINYSMKLASRIMAPLISFRCRTPEQLYEEAKKFTWADFISVKNTFAIFSNVSNSKIKNSQFASLKLKDAIVDSFREKTGERPGIDTRSPDVWLNLHIDNDWAVISLDTSGGSLHRRGYRKDAVEAPMQENVAAAIIRYSEWVGTVPLYDPMCGSGTLLAEALMHYCKIPTGIFRKHYGFEYLPDYDNHLWGKVRKSLDSNVRELPDGYIAGSDISREAVNISRTNIDQLPGGIKVKIDKMDFRNIPTLEKSVIITNPPYGIRIRNGEDLDLFYKSLGDFLKQKCTGSTAYIYFGDRAYLKKIGLKAAWKKPLKTGGLDGRLAKFEMY
jgi:putative N6-adenine-specific DNA methylase